MKMLIAAIALSVALPAVAHAEATPASSEKPKMKCCCKDMAKPMACCEEHGGKAGQDEHAGHDMDQPQKPQ